MHDVSARGFRAPDVGLLLTLGVMWGCSFLFIEIALRGLSPLWIVTARTFVGAIVLLVVVRARGRTLPRSLRLWGHLSVLGIASNAAPWAALAWAQQFMPSGLAALLMALIPVSTLVVSVLAGHERFTAARLGGLLLAVAGVAAMVVGELDNRGKVIAIAVAVGSTVLYGAGAVYAKSYVSANDRPMVVAAGQVICGFVVMLPTAWIVDGLPDATALVPSIVGALVALGVFGTGLAFLLFYTLIERVGATNTTLVSYIIPLVAVLLGAIVLAERLSMTALVGGGLIAGGIWLAQRGTSATTLRLAQPRP